MAGIAPPEGADTVSLEQVAAALASDHMGMSPHGPLQELLKAAAQLMKSNKYEAAVIKYTELLQLPESSTTSASATAIAVPLSIAEECLDRNTRFSCLLNRSKCYTSLTLFEAAVADAQAALRVFPNHERALHRLASAYFAQHDYARASLICQDGLQLHPADKVTIS
jgi:tetratricopeptide (TPR) repeat protein